MKRRRVVLGAWGIVFSFMGIMAVRRVYTGKTDFDGFWRAGRAVVKGGDPYEDTRPGSEDWVLVPSRLEREEAEPGDGEATKGVESAVKRYLPFFGLLMAPLALLPMDVACFVWHAISCAALLGALWHALRLAGRPGGLDSPEAIFAMLATAVFWIASMTMGQIGLVTLYLSLAGIDFAGRGRPWLGGALAGLSAAIKVVPGIVGVYFVLKRRWAAASSMAAAFLLCCALAATVWGPSRAVALHQSWRRDAATTAGARFFENGDSFRFANQSLHALTARTLMHVNAGRSRKPFYVNVADWPPARVARVTQALQLPLVALLVIVCFARRPVEPLRLSEASYLLAVTTFLSPVAWTFHLAVLLPAFLCLWLRRHEKESRVWMGIALVLESGIALPQARALGCLTFSCLAAALGCWRIAVRERREAGEGASTGTAGRAQHAAPLP